MKVLEYLISEISELMDYANRIVIFKEFPNFSFFDLFIGLGCSAVLLDLFLGVFGDFYETDSEFQEEYDNYEPSLDDDDY